MGRMKDYLMDLDDTIRYYHAEKPRPTWYEAFDRLLRIRKPLEKW